MSEYTHENICNMYIYVICIYYIYSVATALITFIL